MDVEKARKNSAYQSAGVLRRTSRSCDYVFNIGWRPFIGPKKRAVTNRQFERTPERLAHGKYLVQGLLTANPATPRKTGPSMAGLYPKARSYFDKR